MKKINLTVFVLTIALTAFGTSAFAKDDAAKMQEELQAKKAELNGHEWEVKLTSGSKQVGTDTLVFKDMKFESKEMTGKGFNTTNYTISLQEGGPTVWETMQSDEKGAVVFWRGEWEGENMHGMMSKQKNGKNEDFYFSSLGSKEIPKETPKVEASPSAEPDSAGEAVGQAVEEAKEGTEAAPAQVEQAANEPAVQEAAQPAQEEVTEKPKKKGWF
jgi:hypothetical protein